MENITSGHWTFAAIFALGFIIFLGWSYRKDLKMHKTHYKGATVLIVSILAAAIFLYLFKGFLS